MNQTLMDLIDMGFEPKDCAEEILGDIQWLISDLADDLNRNIRQVEDEYGREASRYPEGLWDAVQAIQKAVWDLRSAEDKIARAL